MQSLGREAWSSHPNYPAQLLLLGSHENFRRISAMLVAEAQEHGYTASGESLYHRWKAAMRGHEGYEETKLYPFLENRWGVSFRTLVAGHEELHRRDRRVRSAFRATASPQADLQDALTRHHEVLIEHLREEEEAVIPLLLELDPAEFRRVFG